MRNAGLEESQTGIKIAVRNINNLRYADYTTLMAEIKQDLTPKQDRTYKNESHRPIFLMSIDTKIKQNTESSTI